MEQATPDPSTLKKGKKTLHFKIVFGILIAIAPPYLIGYFFSVAPEVTIFTILFSALFSFVFLFWSIKPLSNLVKSIRVFSDGQLNHRIDLRSGDEFEDVGNSFNLLADKLSKKIQDIENQAAIAISEKNKLHEILSSIIDGVIALDFNKNIMFLNKASEELTGYSQSEVRGKKIDEIIHLFSEAEEIFSKTYCQQSFNETAKLVGKEGRQTKVNIITSQIPATVATNLNCILVLHDLSKEEELEQMKLDFVSMASHELKTPLTSIVGYLSVFLGENKNIPKESFNLLNNAFVAARQLQTLISNLLNVNKIEREQLSVSIEQVDYLPILTKAVEDLRSQANQKGIVLILIPPVQPLPKILADPLRLGEVVTNLTSNAINYTNPGGKVEISLKISPTQIETIVADNGVGIPQEAMPHLFNKFFRVSNQLQQTNKGTGLGLYISKSIIEKLHGKIWVESEVGKGSRFFFTIPTATHTAGILDQNRFTSQSLQSGALNY